MSETINRQPSIHITKSKFHRLMLEAQYEMRGNEVDPADEEHIENETKLLVDYVFAHASKYALNHRKLLATTQKQAKTNARIERSSYEDATLFAGLLFQVRKQHFHKGVLPIKETSKDWLILKEITEAAVDFCNDFDLPKRNGFIRYITLALGKMNKFGLAKFHSLHEAICKQQEAEILINQDPTPSATETVMRAYNKIIVDKTGNDFDYRKLPEKYIYFIEVKKECQRLGIKASDYMKSQFAAFDWKAAVPEVSQLVGPKAAERLNKYLFANGITVSSKPKEITIDFSKIRDTD